MKSINFGIVGTGLIAGVIARSITASPGARCVAVSSRRQQTADAFAAHFSDVTAVEGVDALLKLNSVDAVYVATPTSAKETIVLAALGAGKHVLVDKPFASSGSVPRMIDVAANNGLVVMDATHFVHHPRTQTLKEVIPRVVGSRQSLHAAFYTSMDDKTNIRYDIEAEPMGSLGDLGWYAMRAIVEYLQPVGNPDKVAVVAERDATTGAVVRATGMMGFERGKHATFEAGYTSNTGIMDLRLTGPRGVITLDDFPLDWTNSIAYQNEDIQTGYFYRSGRVTRKDVTFVATPSAIPADVLMIDHFVALVHLPRTSCVAGFTAAMLKTQEYLDVAWESARLPGT